MTEIPERAVDKWPALKTDMPPGAHLHDVHAAADFLETTGALAAAAGLGPSGVSRDSRRPEARQSGAPGVELNVDVAALPDYSRDLERYLVRLANDARERRKRIINAISTRQEVLDRQRRSSRSSGRCWEGRSIERPLNARVTGIIERPGYRIEKLTFESRPRLYVTANLYVPAGTGTPSGDSGAARAFRERQGVAELPEAVLEPGAQRLCRPRVRPVRAG